MTDDELDRALFALPLEEPPADMHERIMAATVLRAGPAFRTWELWLLAAAAVLPSGTSPLTCRLIQPYRLDLESQI